ncbi:MAG: alanine--tRNA ligase [bacterium]|nr:alanine--tRNA ligase [bacterium]
MSTPATLSEIREKYLAFFAAKNHAVIPSASLVPENDPTTLFTGSGMQPMLPYLLGQKHPMGNRIADSQKSFRAGDIEDVGDNRHTTFFEMLGNWSFGDYFQEEQLSWIFEFLTEQIHLDPARIYVTAFSGDEDNGLPQDNVAVLIWKRLFQEKGIDAKEINVVSEENAAKVGMHAERIFLYGAKNWWSRAGAPANMPLGEPGGPDSEMFYEFPLVLHDQKFGEHCHPNCDCGRFIEIGNSVFMQYIKVADKKFEPLPNKNIDFGGGLERIAMAAQNTNDIISLDVFQSIVGVLEKLSGTTYADPIFTYSYRVLADHMRASVFLIGDGVVPTNSDQGYFVRRLLRRAVRHWDKLGIQDESIVSLVNPILDYYKDAYPQTFTKKETITQEISREEEKFRKTLKEGLKIFEKIIKTNTSKISGTDTFNLLQSYGFPLEITLELAKERGIDVDVADFQEKLLQHQHLSRTGAEQKFKGGLKDHSDMSVKYHTATHLLHKALKIVLGDHVEQKGSNITSERLRFDFSHPDKMTQEDIKKTEEIINSQIQNDLLVTRAEMSVEQAKEKGALGLFEHKYGDKVSVYSVGEFSCEICGGPHVEKTGTLGTFKITKEESASAGIRRIKAVLE